MLTEAISELTSIEAIFGRMKWGYFLPMSIKTIFCRHRLKLFFADVERGFFFADVDRQYFCRCWSRLVLADVNRCYFRSSSAKAIFGSTSTEAIFGLTSTKIIFRQCWLKLFSSRGRTKLFSVNEGYISADVKRNYFLLMSAEAIFCRGWMRFFSTYIDGGYF